MSIYLLMQDMILNFNDTLPSDSQKFNSSR